jgi:hypothetical protein
VKWVIEGDGEVLLNHEFIGMQAASNIGSGFAAVMLHAARQIEGDMNTLPTENGMLQGGGILPIIGHGGAVEII